MDLQPVCSGRGEPLGWSFGARVSAVVDTDDGGYRDDSRGGRRCGGMDGGDRPRCPETCAAASLPWGSSPCSWRQCHVGSGTSGRCSSYWRQLRRSSPAMEVHRPRRIAIAGWAVLLATGVAAPLFIAFTSMPGLIALSHSWLWWPALQLVSAPALAIAGPFVVLAVRTAAADGVSDGVGAADHHGVGAVTGLWKVAVRGDGVVVATPGNRLLGVRAQSQRVDIWSKPGVHRDVVRAVPRASGPHRGRPDTFATSAIRPQSGIQPVAIARSAKSKVITAPPASQIRCSRPPNRVPITIASGSVSIVAAP